MPEEGPRPLEEDAAGEAAPRPLPRCRDWAPPHRRLRTKTGRLPLRVFFSTDATLSPQAILESYAQRWAIEVCFRDLKQLLGFADSSARKQAAVERLSDGRPFALKMMSGSVNALAGARFAREAEMAARVDDEHLVKLVDVGGAGSGQLYLVMELVEGRSLEDYRSRFGEVPWAVDVLRQSRAECGTGLSSPPTSC